MFERTGGSKLIHIRVPHPSSLVLPTTINKWPSQARCFFFSNFKISNFKISKSLHFSKLLHNTVVSVCTVTLYPII